MPMPWLLWMRDCGDLLLALLPWKKGLESGSIVVAVGFNCVSCLFIGLLWVTFTAKKSVKYCILQLVCRALWDKCPQGSLLVLRDSFFGLESRRVHFRYLAVRVVRETWRRQPGIHLGYPPIENI